MSCGVGQRGGSDLALLWLWHRQAAAALIPPLAWEIPYVAGVALKKPTRTHTEKQLKSGGRGAPHCMTVPTGKGETRGCFVGGQPGNEVRERVILGN